MSNRINTNNPEYLFFSTFSGCGGSGYGAKKALFKVIGGVEIDIALANMYQRNVSSVLVKDIRLLTLKDLSFIPTEQERLAKGQILIWQVSPPCQDFSKANIKNSDITSDRATIISKTFWHYKHFYPEYIILENVKGYINESPYKNFKELLEALNYQIDEYIFNAADIGLPQNRIRLITIATKKGYATPQLNRTVNRHKGWFKSINSLIPSLEICELTDKQKSAISNTLLPVIVQRIGYRNVPQTRIATQPIWTLLASLADDYKGGKRNKLITIVDANGTAYNCDIRCLALLQGFDLDYQWSDNFKVNVRGCGNSVPPLLMEYICNQIRAANS